MHRIAFILLLGIFTFLSSVRSNGQGYIPMLNDSLYWDVSYANMFAFCSAYGFVGPYRYAIDSDTIINGTTYKKFKSFTFINLNIQPAPNCPPFAVDTLVSPNINNAYYLREDTIDKKVYLMDQTFSQEYLWYDFDAQVGDSIVYPGFGTFYIDSIFNITTLDGVTRKYFDSIDPLNPIYGYYIEGIGGTMGPFHPPWHVFEFGPWLMCVSDISENPIFTPISPSGTCYNFITGIESIEQQLKLINVYPNPTQGVINVTGLKPSQELIIYDTTGRKLKQFAKIDSSQFLISELPSGVLLLFLRDNKAEFSIGKIIKL